MADIVQHDPYRIPPAAAASAPTTALTSPQIVLWIGEGFFTSVIATFIVLLMAPGMGWSVLMVYGVLVLAGAFIGNHGGRRIALYAAGVCVSYAFLFFLLLAWLSGHS